MNILTDDFILQGHPILLLKQIRLLEARIEKLERFHGLFATSRGTWNGLLNAEKVAQRQFTDVWRVWQDAKDIDKRQPSTRTGEVKMVKRYLTVLDVSFQGLEGQAGVLSFMRVPGMGRNAPSDVDSQGFVEVEFEIIEGEDLKKLVVSSSTASSAIEDQIIAHFSQGD